MFYLKIIISIIVIIIGINLKIRSKKHTGNKYIILQGIGILCVLVGIASIITNLNFFINGFN